MKDNIKMHEINPLAKDLNEKIRTTLPVVYSLLSDLGKRIYLPKGILRQSAEASEIAHHINATRAVALEDSQLMYLNVSHDMVSKLPPESIYGYPPILGNPELRTLWRARIRTENPLLTDVHISHPIVTSGMTQCFSLLADLFVNSGDIFILSDKCWGNYKLIFDTKAGANIRTYPFFNNEMCLNINAFNQVLNETTTNKLAILLNFPHNPTGYAITINEAQKIRNSIVSCAENGCNILVMIDDAYAGLWYDADVMHESLFGMLVGCHPNVATVKIDGATKEEYAWGLRVGFLTFGLPDNVMHPIEEKLSGLIRANTSGAAQVSQTLLLKAMNSVGYDEQKQQNYETLKARALKVEQVTQDQRYEDLWKVYPSHAGYFICLSLKFGNAETVRKILLNEHGIGTIALSETELRVAYSCIDLDDIEMVFRIIGQVIHSQK